jgi:hypothetical protein
MTSHYRLPVLLIEFDHDKAFALQVRLSMRLIQLVDSRARMQALRTCKTFRGQSWLATCM